MSSRTQTLITRQVGGAVGLSYQVARPTKVRSDSASIGRMERALVVCVHVHALDNVNLAVVWPVLGDGV